MPKRCPICAKRKMFWKMLNRLSKDEREMQRSARLTVDKDGNQKWLPGKRDALNECCCKGNIVSSIGYEYDWKRKKWKSHYHVCQVCGKRWPEKGGYDGDYFNDELGELPNGDLFEIVSQEEKLKQNLKYQGGIKNEKKQNTVCISCNGSAISEPSVC